MSRASIPVTEESSAPIAGTRALVVDDDADVRRAMVRVLNGLGIEVSAARNGLEALDHDLARFDVLFVDLNMPVMNGSELKRELDRRNIGVPVVVVSGESDVADTARAMGAAAWIAKPCSASAVRQALSRVTAATRTTHQRESAVRGPVCATGKRPIHALESAALGVLRPVADRDV